MRSIGAKAIDSTWIPRSEAVFKDLASGPSIASGFIIMTVS